MKKEYDFSKAERGKFYRPHVRLNLPIYLDDDIADLSKSMPSKKRLMCKQW